MIEVSRSLVFEINRFRISDSREKFSRFRQLVLRLKEKRCEILQNCFL